MAFIVSAEYAAFRRKKVGAVHQVWLPVRVIAQRWTAEQQGHLMATNQRFHFAAILGLLFEEKRRGGFGPDDKIRFVSGLAGQTCIAIERFLTVGGIPFMRLIDVGLNQA